MTNPIFMTRLLPSERLLAEAAHDGQQRELQPGKIEERNGVQVMTFAYGGKEGNRAQRRRANHEARKK